MKMEFAERTQTKHLDDARITQPALAKTWDATLVTVLPTAKKKREEANTKRLAELEEKSKREQADRKPMEATEARKNESPTEQTTKPQKTDADILREFEDIVKMSKVKCLRDYDKVLPIDDYFVRHVSTFSSIAYNVEKTNSLVSPYIATMTYCEEVDFSDCHETKTAASAKQTLKVNHWKKVSVRRTPSSFLLGDLSRSGHRNPHPGDQRWPIRFETPTARRSGGRL